MVNEMASGPRRSSWYMHEQGAFAALAANSRDACAHVGLPLPHVDGAWAQRQVVSPVETTSQVEDPWPAEEYSSEVARGQEPKQNECEPLPWTSLGQTYMDWPEDMQEQSFSSANTSIVQAARWQSPRLPRMSSELLVKTTTNTSVGSLPCWSADADDSFATQARGLDGTELS